MNTRKLGRLLVIFLFIFVLPLTMTACAGKGGGGGKKKGGGGGDGDGGGGPGSGGGRKGKRRPKNPNGNPPFNPNGPGPNPSISPNPSPPVNPHANYRCEANNVRPLAPQALNPIPQLPATSPSASPSASPEATPPRPPGSGGFAPPGASLENLGANLQYAVHDGSSPQFTFAYLIDDGRGAAYVTVDLPAAPPDGHDPARPHARPEGGLSLEDRLNRVARHSYSPGATASGLTNPVVQEAWMHRDPGEPQMTFRGKDGRNHRINELLAGDAARALTEANGRYIECAKPGQGRALYFEKGDYTFLPAGPARASIDGVPAALITSDEDRQMLFGEFADAGSVSHLFREWVAATNGLRAEIAQTGQHTSHFDDYLQRATKYTMYALAALQKMPPSSDKQKFEDVWVYNTARTTLAMRDAKLRTPPLNTRSGDDIVAKLFDQSETDGKWSALRHQAEIIAGNRNSLNRLFLRPGATGPTPPAPPGGPLAHTPPSDMDI